MNWLRSMFSKAAPSPSNDDDAAEQLLALLDDHSEKWGVDHLGIAAELGRKSQEAVAEGCYDEAWGLLHDKQAHYLSHAQRCGFTARQTLALDGSLHLAMANIRRLEGNHDGALVHILYADMTDDRKTKSMAKLLRAYFNRCKLTNTKLDEAVAFVEHQRERPSIRVNQLKVIEWRERG